MKKTKKRVISCVMTAALLVTTIPFPAIAKTSGNLYGDANGDGKIDLLDALAIDRYLAGTAEDNFQSANADVNHDSVVDSKDSMILKKYLAEWDITLEPDILTVSFYDGDRLKYLLLQNHLRKMRFYLDIIRIKNVRFHSMQIIR